MSGLLDVVCYNSSRSVHDIALYEQGRVFLPEQETPRPREVMHVAGIITGKQATSSWQAGRQASEVDFYTIKGYVERYFDAFGVTKDISYVATNERNDMHPGRTANILLNGHCVGFVGQVHPQMTGKLKLPAVYVFEIDLEQLMLNVPQQVSYTSVARFPKIDRDIALLVPDTVTHAMVQATIMTHGGDYLTSVTLFDRYVGDELPTGYKSLAYTLTYQNIEETLTEAVITEAYDQLVKALETECDAQIR